MGQNASGFKPLLLQKQFPALDNWNMCSKDCCQDKCSLDHEEPGKFDRSQVCNYIGYSIAFVPHIEPTQLLKVALNVSHI